ncbi:MAG: TIGR03084 family protein [Dehalococcoidia bacterium]|nr:MAG: TIGR03084 family protein [Dehalococcoidia bacterium]
MDDLIDDLVAEQDDLDAAICETPATLWLAPSPAEGWLMRDCIAHLADLDETAAIIAETGEYPKRERRAGEGALAAGQVDARALTIPELLAWWRASRARLAAALRKTDPKARLPWAGMAMGARSFATARLMEAWSHGLDARDAAGVPHHDTDRLRHIAHLGYSTRDFAYRARGMEPNTAPLYVEVIAPSGAVWTWGLPEAADRITGTASDFCRVVTQRIHYSDTALVATGDAAREFLVIAQAFAGPPGAGRPPRGESEG